MHNAFMIGNLQEKFEQMLAVVQRQINKIETLQSAIGELQTRQIESESRIEGLFKLVRRKQDEEHSLRISIANAYSEIEGLKRMVKESRITNEELRL